jgi:hypothetical protein
MEVDHEDIVEDLVVPDPNLPQGSSEPPAAARPSFDINQLDTLMGPEQVSSRPASAPPPPPIESFEEVPRSWLAQNYLLFVTFFGGALFGYILSKF